MKKVKDLTNEQLKGAVLAIIANYELAFGEIDSDYDLFVEVLEYDEKQVVFHYAYEYNTIGESGNQGFNVKLTKKKLVLNDKEDLKDLIYQVEDVIKSIISNPVIHA